mmetsp:Transcript_10839/g.34359  ORF Transcript_10839/g.34359 Transcript_10839/m.34359 type:complete len:224 (-) Transcript_10839:1099-1770(-)
MHHVAAAAWVSLKAARHAPPPVEIGAGREPAEHDSLPEEALGRDRAEAPGEPRLQQLAELRLLLRFLLPCLLLLQLLQRAPAGRGARLELRSPRRLFDLRPRRLPPLRRVERRCPVQLPDVAVLGVLLVVFEDDARAAVGQQLGHDALAAPAVLDAVAKLRHVRRLPLPALGAQGLGPPLAVQLLVVRLVRLVGELIEPPLSPPPAAAAAGDAAAGGDGSEQG